jgi:predicted anti-sigma-YlaC factor YlaD
MAMLTCRQVADRASDYLEREASPFTRLQIRLHLLMCRACRQYVRQLALTRDALRAMGHDDRVPAEGARGAFRRWTSDDRF